MAKTATVATTNESGFTGQIKSWPERIKTFYNDVRVEMKKVTTPTRKEVQSTTIVVIVTVLVFIPLQTSFRSPYRISLPPA